MNKNVHIYAKGEFMNISGSVKDRAAQAMIADGIRRGLLTKDKTIIDATSGNTGIAYAMAGAALGYRVKLTMPANVTTERKKIMRAYGAEIIETDPIEGIDGAYDECRRIVAENPEKYFYPDQYSNEQNWKAHYYGTAEEILKQTENKITHFVAGTGTAGTFMGCTKKFREVNPQIKCYNMTPDSPFHGIEG
ncbi:MAG: PLP-dependent cysteine synthase family protein, partial [Porcipelethomonas sp.]